MVANDSEHPIEHITTGLKVKFRIFGTTIIRGHWDAIETMLGGQEDVMRWIRRALQLGMGCIHSILVTIV